MIKVRSGIFETNSSATHAFNIYIGDDCVLTSYTEDEDPADVYLDESDLEDILRCIPTEKLLDELQRRGINEEDKI